MASIRHPISKIYCFNRHLKIPPCSRGYPSVKAAPHAIDCYFVERNRHYDENPRRAGNKIWGRERTVAAFDPANNCKDLTYR